MQSLWSSLSSVRHQCNQYQYLFVYVIRPLACGRESSPFRSRLHYDCTVAHLFLLVEHYKPIISVDTWNSLCLLLSFSASRSLSYHCFPTGTQLIQISVSGSRRAQQSNQFVTGISIRELRATAALFDYFDLSGIADFLSKTRTSIKVNSNP